MGLDAHVRCRCFEEKKLKPGPIPYDDLYIDEEGYLYSRTLDEAEDELGLDEFYRLYEDLIDKFRKWLDEPCEHDWGEACTERVGNIMGTAAFRVLVKNSGGEEKYPLLSNMLPDGNGGQYPVELARPTLEELDDLIERFKNLDGWVLKRKKMQNLMPDYSNPPDEKLHVEGEHDPDAVDEEWCDETHSSCLLYCGGYHIDLVQDKVVFQHVPENRVSSHFIETFYSLKDGKPIIEFLDSDEGFQLQHLLRVDYDDNKCKRYEFWTEPASNLYYHSTERYTLEALRRLLVASIEFQNPIVWC